MAVTRAQWAEAFLTKIGEPVTPGNVQAITAWEVAEGGAFANTAAYNPLNTTLQEPGSTPINDLGGGIGVQAFTSWQEGLDANAQVIEQGQYAGIRAALAQGDNPQGVADEVARSPWGTNPFSASAGDRLTAAQIKSGLPGAQNLAGPPAGGGQNPQAPQGGPGFDWNPLSWPGQLISKATNPVTGTIQEAVVLAPILLGAAALGVIGLAKATGARQKIDTAAEEFNKTAPLAMFAVP